MTKLDNISIEIIKMWEDHYYNKDNDYVPCVRIKYKLYPFKTECVAYIFKDEFDKLKDPNELLPFLKESVINSTKEALFLQKIDNYAKYFKRKKIKIDITKELVADIL